VIGDLGNRSLAARLPGLAAELRPDMPDPATVSFGSSKRLWWRCAAGHEWQATPKARGRGSGCPYCSGRLTEPSTSLAAMNLQLAIEWNELRNGRLRPWDVRPSARRRVWWLCAAGHEWAASVAARTAGSGCPACAAPGQARRRGGSLLSSHPHLSTEWSFDRNGPLDEFVLAGSEQRFWWQCSIDSEHVWESSAAQRSRGQGCPYCAGKRVTATQSLAGRFPDVAAEWDRDRNEGLTPEAVAPSSHRRAWWRCGVNRLHVWQATVANRTAGGTGCPYCRGARVLVPDSLGALYPQLVREWLTDLNECRDPAATAPASGARVWWQCERGHDPWRARVVDRTRGSGCPACARTVATPTESLAALSPALVGEWHPQRNKPLGPEMVRAFSNKTVWWICIEGHEWRAQIGQRVKWSTGCPACASSVRRGVALAEARPDLAAEWIAHLNPTLPGGVAAGSHAAAWWRCSANPAHVWRAPIRNRVRGNTGCPYCAHKLPTYETSLAASSPQLGDEWHPDLNGWLSPADVLARSSRRVWWRCGLGHTWEAAPGQRARGTGCPTCARARPR
jgi:hypothetical protein